MEIEALYDTYMDTVYRFFYVKSFDRSTAEDLTSETFMAVLEKMQDNYAIADSKKFLYGVMRHVWIEYLKKKYRRAEYAIDDIDDFSSYVEETIDSCDGADMRERALKFINQLPQKQRHIVSLRLVDEMSIKDISIELSADRNYVKTTYKRGLKRLKWLITNQDLTERSTL